MKRTIRSILATIVMVGTIVAFIWYIKHNPAIIDQLKQTSLTAVVAIVLLHLGGLIALAVILHASLRIYNKSMPPSENFLLTAYSSLVNFFGPGQSGPGLRAAYLKIKHDLKIKQYILVTLIYYAFYAIISGILLIAAIRPWWQIVLLTLFIALGCIVIIKLFMRRNKDLLKGVSRQQYTKPIIIIAIATLVQITFLSITYFIELNTVSSNVSFGQALTYTGAANFALFVALTPGAIGFREAFLVFTNDLHHISNDVIVAANVLDRAAYILFLGIIFLVTLGMHANKRLQISKIKKAEAAESNT